MHDAGRVTAASPRRGHHYVIVEGARPPGAASHALQGASSHTWSPRPPTHRPPPRDSMDSEKLHQRRMIHAPTRPSRPGQRQLTPGTLPYPASTAAPRAHNRNPPRHRRPHPHATPSRSLTPTSSRRPHSHPFPHDFPCFFGAANPLRPPSICPQPTQATHAAPPPSASLAHTPAPRVL